MGSPFWEDWIEEYERLPNRPTAHRLPANCESELRAVAAAFKATGLPLSGPTQAAAVAGIVLAELWGRGLVVGPAVAPAARNHSGLLVEGDRYVVLLDCGHWTQTRIPESVDGWDCWFGHGRRLAAWTHGDRKPAILATWELAADHGSAPGVPPTTPCPGVESGLSLA